MLSCEICEIFKNTIFYRTPPVAASVIVSWSQGVPLNQIWGFQPQWKIAVSALSTFNKNMIKASDLAAFIIIIISLLF